MPSPASTAPFFAWTSVAAFLIGLGSVAALLAAGRVQPDPTPAHGAVVAVAVKPTGTLGVDPDGGVLNARGLLAGRRRGTRVTVTNLTGTRRTLRLRALAASRDLDAAVTVRISAGGRILYVGPLGRLRAGRRVPLVLRPGRPTGLGIAVELASEARGYEGRVVELALELGT